MVTSFILILKCPKPEKSFRRLAPKLSTRPEVNQCEVMQNFFLPPHSINIHFVCVWCGYCILLLFAMADSAGFVTGHMAVEIERAV